MNKVIKYHKILKMTYIAMAFSTSFGYSSLFFYVELLQLKVTVVALWLTTLILLIMAFIVSKQLIGLLNATGRIKRP